ncbi:MAG TPA: GspE/PulE family protein [Patescibacteria group bacterium]|jgi:type IV pilus assembly protein PilB|nr:GspE/PulE family protein [Patescibacteria group bacterium]
MLTPTDKHIRLKQVYSELDRKFEEEETQRLAKEDQLPYINLYGFPIDYNALSLISKKDAAEIKSVVFYKEGRNLKLGTTTPSFPVFEVVENLKQQSYFVEVYLISNSSFNHVMELYKRVIDASRKSQDIKISSEAQEVEISSLKDLAHKLQSSSATEMIEIILNAALSLESSDVHIEPNQTELKIRYRIDGVLQDVAVLPKEIYHHQLISRIKILSKLKLNVTAVPQDGSFSLTFNSQPIDIRVSVLPSAFGESLVLRILRQDKGNLKFEELGIDGVAFERLSKQLEKPNGMILTTGPTGSGKTTTLYAILSKMNEPGVKIITLEDPVEYKIPGITQTPIDAGAGLTFAAGLRAILRQDPDVVMVGEMRDLETAETAAQAALTGHIVLSTLHTNDAAGAIPRLIDLGVKPFVLAPAINAIIAQRLVRKICTKCKTEYTPEKSLVGRVHMILAAIPKSAKVAVPTKLKFYHSPGCKECKGLGYKGRIGVYEVFTINEAIEKLITVSASNTEIKKQAIADGMLTMSQDGVLKALSGITDIEEIFRVTED